MATIITRLSWEELRHNSNINSAKQMLSCFFQIGYEKMTCTYNDPLQICIAYLKLTKLHRVCDTYIENY